MSTQENQMQVDDNATKAVLNERLEGIGWAVLLITSGIIWLLPESQVPPGSWLVAAGVILLGLNAVRAAYGIRLNGFSLGVGILALLAGLGDFYNFKLPLVPIVLILIGVFLLLNALRARVPTSTTRNRWCGGWQGEQGQDHVQGPEAGH